jgi:hypothetical protein
MYPIHPIYRNWKLILRRERKAAYGNGKKPTSSMHGNKLYK